MGDPVGFPENQKVQLVMLPVSADMLELLEVACDHLAKAEGLKFDSVGEFLAWHLFDGGEDDGLKAILKRYKRIR